uniref:Uncharacterized protein n=1 Tax=Arundo donax TaxID=35708 RepID=A0A0A9B0I7_ARUDO
MRWVNPDGNQARCVQKGWKVNGDCGCVVEDVRGLSGRRARTPAEIAALIQYA